MRIVQFIQEMQNYSHDLRLSGKKIAIVPTMGYLHAGHLNLVSIAKKLADVVILSIFVNPIQFGKNEDYGKYPRSFEGDSKKAEEAGVDFIFFPHVTEMYPTLYETYIYTDKVSNILEGEIRPGHFQGVITVVMKLFNITQANYAIFGQKDAQQLWLIRRMVQDLNIPIQIIISPIIREKDGLAMSSRNTYLKKDEREQSTVIYQAIQKAKDAVRKGERDAKQIEEITIHELEQISVLKIDYAKIVHWENFEPVSIIENPKESMLVLAVRFPSVRLIDNAFLG